MTHPVGPFDVVALLDASGTFFRTLDEAFSGATEQDWDDARRIDPVACGADGAWHLEFRCFAVRRPGGSVALVDTGIGPAASPASGWAPVPGHLPDRLTEASIDVDAVDLVILTHLHEDHYGWSVTPTGLPMFPNARYVVQQRELDTLGAEEAVVQYVLDPLRRTGQVHAVDGQSCLVSDSGTRLSVVPTPGHTPGHQSVLITGDHDQLVITGDVLVHAVQLANPEVSYRGEIDPEAARQSRHALLARARQQRALLATAHLTQPFVTADWP